MKIKQISSICLKIWFYTWKKKTNKHSLYCISVLLFKIRHNSLKIDKFNIHSINWLKSTLLWKALTKLFVTMNINFLIYYKWVNINSKISYDQKWWYWNVLNELNLLNAQTISKDVPLVLIQCKISRFLSHCGRLLSAVSTTASHDQYQIITKWFSNLALFKDILAQYLYSWITIHLTYSILTTVFLEKKKFKATLRKIKIKAHFRLVVQQFKRIK